MSNLVKLNERRDYLSDQWKYHIDAFWENIKLNDKMAFQIKRDTNRLEHLHRYYDRLNAKCRELGEAEESKIKQKMSVVKGMIERTNRSNELLKFQLDLIWVDIDYHCLHYNNYLKKIGRSLMITGEKVSRITKAKARHMECEDCCLCLSSHKLKNIVTTNCKHTFGKSCFEKYIDKQYQNQNNIVCPLCRNSDLTFTIYRIRR
jgi:hypothetical protein